MSRAFAIGISVCLLMLGVSFFVVGYRWWVSMALIIGLILSWVGSLGLLRAWQNELSSFRTSLLWLVHGSTFVGCIAGIVFVIPEPVIDDSMLRWAAALSGISIVCIGSFFRYAQQKQEQELLVFLRYILWGLGLFVGLLFVLGWTEVIWDVQMALVFCVLQAIFSCEGVWRTNKQLRRVWNGAQISSERLLRNISMELLWSRSNPISSIFDRLERFFGVDIKGTWAIHFIRQAIEPLFLSVLLLGWLASSVVLVDTHEQGVREHFGVAEEMALEAGVHVKLPWPLGAIHKVPAHRILQMSIGHEEPESPEEESSPESVLWANQHADEEFTLLLGDGHDLISADGVLHYQITDVHEYLYGTQNPEDLLRSIAYRVLMHETASRTLDEALSENLNELAKQVAQRIASEVAQVNIGIEPVIFSFSALHPPVSVALDYQQVISAQIDRDTKIIRAETYERQSLRKVETEQYGEKIKAAQASLDRIATAVGEAAAFDGLRQTVRSNEELYLFRRRQEALEKNLQGRDLLIIDHRLEKQGAQLWIQE